MESEKLQIESE